MPLKRYRIHCHIDVLASDTEMASLTAQVALTVAMRDSAVVHYGTSGTPVDLLAMQRGRRKGKAALKFNQTHDPIQAALALREQQEE